MVPAPGSTGSANPVETRSRAANWSATLLTASDGVTTPTVAADCNVKVWPCRAVCVTGWGIRVASGGRDSAVLVRHRDGLWNVASTEHDYVSQEGVETVQADPVAPAVGEGVDFVVRAENPLELR